MSKMMLKGRKSCTNKTFLYSLFLTSILGMISLPVFGWDFCCQCDPSINSPYEIKSEIRVAYYHPSSKKIRRIYGEGWADYQLEFSKKIKGFWNVFEAGGCSCLNNVETSIWMGVSGFSKNGASIGFHNKTNLQLVPINFGAKVFYPIFNSMKIYIGGAACYSLLRIHDHSDYVHEHIKKENWGALFQSGLTYEYCERIILSAFFDYYFQEFDFHGHRYNPSGKSGSYQERRFIERSNMDMSGYKLGIGFGFLF